ncbi:MAG: glycoside hydrolase family 65 protein [Burkholderiaceae bacterium]
MTISADNTQAAQAGWTISFDRYDPQDEGRREVIAALGNGLFVTRATPTDACRDGVHYPGTYHAGCYNRLSETIIGEHDEIESLVNLPNWLPLSFRIDGGAWFSLDQVEILEYAHELDMRTGTACRTFRVRDAQGRQTQIREHRMVSMAAPNLCAVSYRLVPLNWSGSLEFRSALDGRVINDNVKRFEDYAKHHLTDYSVGALTDDEAMLQCFTSGSRTQVVMAMRTRCLQADASTATVIENDSSIAHLIRALAETGKEIRVEKIAALCTSLDFAPNDPVQVVQAALHSALDYDGLLAQHGRAWREIWAGVALEVDDAKLACPLRFHAFHIMQTIAPHTFQLDAGVPARGWHGEGYRGHIFWDELYVLPFLNFRFPELTREALMYRYRRLDAARAAAREAGYEGAMYPWRSAGDGREVTPRHQKNLLNGAWMHDHTYRQRHIGSAIAFNIWNYWLATADVEFLADCGAEMLIEIARFWAGIARMNPRSGRYEITGVIGPDEYHNAYPGRSQAGLDNNAYTNVMAAWTLLRAQDVLRVLPGKSCSLLRQRLDLQETELERWDEISRKLHIPFHGDNIISQFDGFEQLLEFSEDMLPPSLAKERTDWALGAIGRSTDEFQLTKQADVLALFYLLPEAEVIALLDRMGYRFDHAALLRTAHYYLDRTVHDSSLSHVVYAGALARVDPELSWKLYQQVLHTDLNPLKGESIAEGVHLGAMGGSLDILQRRYLGISACADGLHIDPALPAALGRVRLTIHFRGALLHIESCGRNLLVSADASNKREVILFHRESRSCLEPCGSLQIAARAADSNDNG